MYKEKRGENLMRSFVFPLNYATVSELFIIFLIDKEEENTESNIQ